MREPHTDLRVYSLQILSFHATLSTSYSKSRACIYILRSTCKRIKPTCRGGRGALLLLLCVSNRKPFVSKPGVNVYGLQRASFSFSARSFSTFILNTSLPIGMGLGNAERGSHRLDGRQEGGQYCCWWRWHVRCQAAGNACRDKPHSSGCRFEWWGEDPARGCFWRRLQLPRTEPYDL